MEKPAETYRVRAANRDDSEAVAAILVEAFPTLYRMAFGTASVEKNVEVMDALFQAGHLSLDQTRVCEGEAGIVGIAILHTGYSIGRGSAREYGRLLRRHLSPMAAGRAWWGGLSANVSLNQRIPHAPDLAYIEALAVKQTERGRGVGALLIEDAFAWAQRHQRPRVALHVLHSNAPARRLYERMGFRLWQPTLAHRLRNRFAPLSSWSALLMLRELDCLNSDLMDVAEGL